jgi:hypothetical protein
MEPQTRHPADRPAHEPKPDLEPRSSFWVSRPGLTTVAFLLIAVFLLVSEHRAHALGFLPYLLLLACPFLHVFMHGGHGRHGGRRGHVPGPRADRTPRNGPQPGTGA